MSLDSVTVTGPKGQIASRELVEHRRRIEPQAVPLRDDLHCLMGVNICNTQLIHTAEGIVVVDTGRSSADGEAIMAIAASLSEKPIIAVVYTHSHYTLGTAPIIEKYPGIPVVGHHLIHENLSQGLTIDRRFMGRRGRMEAAALLPKEGPDADAIGSRISTPGSMAYVRPTVELTHDGEKITLGGVEFTFFVSHSFDTNDTIILWLEDRRAIVHNHFADNFPNIYPIQGGLYRDPTTWLTGIDLMRGLEPEHLLSTHGRPTSGRAECAERLTITRDALQFVYDQTIRGMNKHLLPDEIVDFVRLPESLRDHDLTRQTYGMVANHVRGVYSGRAGWFDGDAASIFPPSPDERARCLIRDLGGPAEALRRAQEAVDAGEYRWAAELCRNLYQSDPDVPGVRELYARVLRHFGYRATAWTIRNYCLSQALQIEGVISVVDRDRTLDDEIVQRIAPLALVQMLRFRVDPTQMPKSPTRLVVELSDRSFCCELILRNGVVECREVDPKDKDGAQPALTCTTLQWARFVDSRRPVGDIVSEADVLCTPTAAEVRGFLRAFDG